MVPPYPALASEKNVIFTQMFTLRVLLTGVEKIFASFREKYVTIVSNAFLGRVPGANVTDRSESSYQKAKK